MTFSYVHSILFLASVSFAGWNADAGQLRCEKVFGPIQSEIKVTSSSSSRRSRALDQVKFAKNPADQKTILENIKILPSVDLLLNKFELSKVAAGEIQLKDATWGNALRQVNFKTLDHAAGFSDWRQIPNIDSKPLLQVLALTQAQMMKDLIPEESLGKFRTSDVGNGATWTGYTREEYEVLKANPFLNVKVNSKQDSKYFLEISYTSAKDLSETLFKRVTHFQSDVASLMKTNSRPTEAQLIKLLADVYRDLISIHPFKDGNGRSLKKFVFEFIFDKFDLAAPIYPDHDVDFTLSAEAFAQVIYEGSMRAKQFIAELTQLAQQKKDIRPAFKNLVVSSSDQDPLLAEKITRLEVLVDKSYTFSELKNSFSPLSQDFMDSFAVQSGSKMEWQTKMKRHYEETVVWRGVPFFTWRMSDFEILSYFQALDSELASMHVYKITDSNTSAKAYRKAIQSDFEKFNSDVRDPKRMSEFLYAHSNMGDSFTDSYGISFSKDPRVALAFSLGAVSVAPFKGLKDLPRLLVSQGEVIKDRLIFGVYRGKKDFDLNVEAKRNKFTLTYPEQQEVVAIGGVDPESLLVVKRVNKSGEITESFVRSPQRPDQLLKIRGDWNPGQDIDPSTVIKTFTIDRWR